MLRSTLAKRAWLLFFLAAFALYLYGLGRLPLIGPDEPRYAQIAREMLERGDFVTPTLGGLPWFEKPALLYWMMMAAFAAFGVSEWAARLGPACSGLLTGVLIYLVGRRVEKESAEAAKESAQEKEALSSSSASAAARGLGLWSGAALLSSAGMIVFSRGASFDVIVTMTLTAALACFIICELATTEASRRWWLAGFYAAVGASLLAKGLIGVVIPFGVVAAYFLLRREWPRRTVLLSLLWGVPLALLVAAAWYAPVIARHGRTFLDQFIIQHHFARYLSNKYRHPQPFYFYLPMMALFALPWTAFLAASLAHARRWNWRSPTASSKLRVFALVWVAVPVAFFSLSGSKLPGYILPALPGAALLIGDRLASFARGEEGGIRSMRATGAGLLLCVAIVVYLARVGHLSTGRVLAVALPLMFAGLFALVRTRLRRWCAGLLIGATFAATALAVNLLIEQGARSESVRDLLAQASARGYASAPVLELHTVERTAEFYAAGRIARGPDGEVVKFEGVQQIAETARRGGGQALVIVPLEYAGQLFDYAPLQPELIGDNGAVALVAVRTR
ncbi:MAG TPA: phospholipid carrier-dependent glycosyltransferase [Pyrinomonadaceae bacterium]|nr:phospholipid carrier-dependent glycosyltransferase [Pyrinomonadaceae bacterium]